MKGMLKRALGAMTAAAMAVVGMTVLAGTANAEVGDLTLTNNISITGNVKSLEGRTFEYVKLANLSKYEAAGQDSALTVETVQDFTPGQDGLPTNPSVWYAVAVTAHKHGWDFGIEDMSVASDPMLWVADNLVNDQEDDLHAGDLRDFVTELVAALDEQTVTWTRETASPANGSLDMVLDGEDEGPGIYLIRDTTTSVSDWSVSVPMLVATKVTVKTGVDFPVKNINGTVAIKNEPTTLTKTVNDDTSPSVGDVLTYTLEAAVPNWIGKDAASAKFSFTDTPDMGVTVLFGSFEVSVVDEKDPDVAEDDETLVDSSRTGWNRADTADLIRPTTASGDSWDAVHDSNPWPAMEGEFGLANESFTVVLDDQMRQWALNENLIGKTVRVTYQVRVNDDAVAVWHSNSAQVNNNGSVSEWVEERRAPNAEFVLKKTQGDGVTPLAGAKFEITDESGKPLSFTFSAETNMYIYDPNSSNTVIETKSYSTMIGGLGEGVYTMTEIEAPEGYWDTGLPSIELSVDEEGNISFTKKSDLFDLVTLPDSGSGYSSRGIVRPVTVKNINSITQLPLTGAAGIAMFVVLGLLIAGVGVTVYVKSRGVRNALRG